MDGSLDHLLRTQIVRELAQELARSHIAAVSLPRLVTMLNVVVEFPHAGAAEEGLSRRVVGGYDAGTLRPLRVGQLEGRIPTGDEGE